MALRITRLIKTTKNDTERNISQSFIRKAHYVDYLQVECRYTVGRGAICFVRSCPRHFWPKIYGQDWLKCLNEMNLKNYIFLPLITR